MFTLAMPQSLPVADRNRFGVLQPVGEDRGRESVRRRVLHLDRFIERVERNQVQHRREGLVLHDGPVVFGANDGGRDEVALALEDLLAA